MRISFLTLSLRQRGGGSHQNAILFIRALRGHGHAVSVFTLGDDDDPPHDITVHNVKDGSGAFSATLKSRARIMKGLETQTDVFLAYGHALLWAAGLYRMQGTKPVAVYIDSHLDSMKEQHRFSLIHRLKHRAWELVRGRALARGVDLIIAVSPYLKGRLIRAGFPTSKISVIPNSFDLIPPVSRIKNSPSIRVLYAGRLSPEKGVDILIDAFSQLPTDVSAFLRIVGSGAERDALQEQTRLRAISNKVGFAGWMSREDLADEYAAADVVVVPSRVPEPFGRTVVEALNAGVPVIVPEGSGAAWVADSAGVTFARGDAASLTGALTKVISDRTLRQALGERGRARARDFAVQIVGVQLAHSLEAILSS